MLNELSSPSLYSIIRNANVMEKILYHDSIQIMGGIVFVIFG